MSSVATALPHVNGTRVVSAETRREVDFLKQILQIRDDVFASKHPRIHLPPKVIEQVAPRPPQTTAPSRPSTNGIAHASNTALSFSPRPDSSLQQTTQASEFVPPAQHIQRPYSAKSASSGIDPVLLTKSDHLIRAELQLKRQQIERLLKDQVDKKGRGNDNDEREAHFNVEECLMQAHLRVPPLSGLQSPTNNSEGAESFDENSYYSSKADSWSPEDVDVNQASHADVTGTHVSAEKQPARAVQTAPTVIDLDEETYEPADDIEIYEPEQVDLGDDADEEDYSPPPADVGPSEPNRGRVRDRGVGNGGANGSRRNSPSGPAPPLQNPRKRRRDERRQEKRREQQANKRAVRSPEPYIKEEPQSPPLLAESQPSKRRALQPVPHDDEVLSPRAPIYYRENDEPTSPTVIHTPQQRRPQPQEQDLRRVASLQYARRPYSPGGGNGEVYAIPPEYRPIRAASHAFADRPEVPVFREAPSRASMAPRYVRERSRSPIYEPMHPPRRIVVDQYGNKYYAAPVDARESAAPPSRRVEVDPYYERAATREPTIRAPVRTEIYEDEIGQRMPPPPPRRYMEAAEPELIEARPYRQREASRRPVEVEYRSQELLERRQVPQYEEMGPPQYMPSRAYSVRPEVVRRDMPEGYVRHESIQPGSVRASAQPRYREVSLAQQEPERFAMAPPESRRYVEEEIVPEAYPALPRHVSYRY